MERLTLDLRMATSPRRPPDPRLLILSVDEASLLAEPQSLAEQADRFGRSLEHALRAGASGVAIDFLLPRRWSESQAFSQLVLGRQAQLTLAALSTPNGEVVGTECVSGLTAAALGPAALSRVFGFVNLSEDDDGVARQAHLLYRDREGRLRQTWAGRAMDTLDVPAARAPNGRPPFRIDFRVDWKRFGRVSWKDVDRRLAEEPDAFRRKLLLVGGEFAGAGDDFHRTPLGGSEAVSGVVLQALILNTLLEGTPIRDAEPALWAPALVLALGLVVACAIGVARRRDFVALSVSVGVALAGAGWMAFRVSALLIPLAGPLLGLILAGAAGRLARARLTVLSREVQ
jgi:CHASE2 domain-containing sensor protein